MRFLVLSLLLLQGCSWLTAVAESPQAGVDYFDWARERNERAIYEKTIERITVLGAPYCSVDVSPDDYPLLVSLLGVRNPRYILEKNVIVYPLGDHEILAHECAHAILNRSEASSQCLQQLAAMAVQQDYSREMKFSSDR